MSRNKKLLNGIKKEYMKLPNKVVDINLSSEATRIYIIFLRYSDQFNPSIKLLCDKTKLSKPSIRKYVKELVDRNMLVKIFFLRGRVSKYEFTHPSVWRDRPFEKQES